jgi:hypothetical protein
LQRKFPSFHVLLFWNFFHSDSPWSLTISNSIFFSYIRYWNGTTVWECDDKSFGKYQVCAGSVTIRRRHRIFVFVFSCLVNASRRHRWRFLSILEINHFGSVFRQLRVKCFRFSLIGEWKDEEWKKHFKN